MNVVLHGLDIDLIYLRSIGPAISPFNQALDIERIALRNGLDGSIRAIAHPAGYLELLRAQSHRFAEEDTLDAAGDAKAAGDFQGP